MLAVKQMAKLKSVSNTFHIAKYACREANGEIEER